MAKMPKRTLATRNPVVGEFMRALLELHSDLSAKNSARIGSLTSPERRGLNQHANDREADKHNE